MVTFAGPVRQVRATQGNSRYGSSFQEYSSHHLFVRIAPVLRKFPESRLQLACEAGESGKIARRFARLVPCLVHRAQHRRRVRTRRL